MVAWTAADLPSSLPERLGSMWSGHARSTALLRAKRAVERLSSAGRRYLAREQLRGRGGVAVEGVIEPVPREEHLVRRVERIERA